MRINIDAEIRSLKRRVSAIERSRESPHQHVSALHKDLLASKRGRSNGSIGHSAGSVR